MDRPGRPQTVIGGHGIFGKIIQRLHINRSSPDWCRYIHRSPAVIHRTVDSRSQKGLVSRFGSHRSGQGIIRRGVNSQVTLKILRILRLTYSRLIHLGGTGNIHLGIVGRLYPQQGKIKFFRVRADIRSSVGGISVNLRIGVSRDTSTGT